MCRKPQLIGFFGFAALLCCGCGDFQRSADRTPAMRRDHSDAAGDETVPGAATESDQSDVGGSGQGEGPNGVAAPGNPNSGPLPALPDASAETPETSDGGTTTQPPPPRRDGGRDPGDAEGSEGLPAAPDGGAEGGEIAACPAMPNDPGCVATGLRDSNGCDEWFCSYGCTISERSPAPESYHVTGMHMAWFKGLLYVLTIESGTRLWLTPFTYDTSRCVEVPAGRQEVLAVPRGISLSRPHLLVAGGRLLAVWERYAATVDASMWEINMTEPLVQGPIVTLHSATYSVTQMGEYPYAWQVGTHGDGVALVTAAGENWTVSPSTLTMTTRSFRADGGQTGEFAAQFAVEASVGMGDFEVFSNGRFIHAWLPGFYATGAIRGDIYRYELDTATGLAALHFIIHNEGDMTLRSAAPLGYEGTWAYWLGNADFADPQAVVGLMPFGGAEMETFSGAPYIGQSWFVATGANRFVALVEPRVDTPGTTYTPRLHLLALSGVALMEPVEILASENSFTQPWQIVSNGTRAFDIMFNTTGEDNNGLEIFLMRVACAGLGSGG